MSVRTTADEHRDNAVEGITTAINHFSKIVVERCSGTETFAKGYLALMTRSMSELIAMRENLEHYEGD